MALSEASKRDVAHTQLRRLETLTDCAYAVALVLIIQWLPLPHESTTGGVRVLLSQLFAEYAGNLMSIGIAVMISMGIMVQMISSLVLPRR